MTVTPASSAGTLLAGNAEQLAIQPAGLWGWPTGQITDRLPWVHSHYYYHPALPTDAGGWLASLAGWFTSSNSRLGWPSSSLVIDCVDDLTQPAKRKKATASHLRQKRAEERAGAGSRHLTRFRYLSGFSRLGGFLSTFVVLPHAPFVSSFFCLASQPTC